jgi:hypothetical protein
VVVERLALGVDADFAAPRSWCDRLPQPANVRGWCSRTMTGRVMLRRGSPRRRGGWPLPVIGSSCPNTPRCIAQSLQPLAAAGPARFYGDEAHRLVWPGRRCRAVRLWRCAIARKPGGLSPFGGPRGSRCSADHRGRCGPGWRRCVPGRLAGRTHRGRGRGRRDDLGEIGPCTSRPGELHFFHVMPYLPSLLEPSTDLGLRVRRACSASAGHRAADRRLAPIRL